MMQKWINLTEVKCDPAREENFKDWIFNIHLPDVLDTPGFLEARQYVEKEYRDGRGKYLHVYNIETDDIDQTMKIRRAAREAERERGRYSVTRDNLIIAVWRDVLWKQIAERVAPDYRETNSPKWINMFEVNIDPLSEEEYIDFVVNIRLREILDTPGFVGARMYEMKEFRDGRGKFLLLYYIETDDIEKTMKVRLDRRAEEKKQRPSSLSSHKSAMIVWRDVLWRQVAGRVAPGKSETTNPLPW